MLAAIDGTDVVVVIEAVLVIRRPVPTRLRQWMQTTAIFSVSIYCRPTTTPIEIAQMMMLLLPTDVITAATTTDIAVTMPTDRQTPMRLPPILHPLTMTLFVEM